MGAHGSKGKKSADQLARAKELAAREAAAAAAKKKREKLDPKDFIITGREGTVVVKESGTIDGEQFNVENCRDCDIFLLDHMDSSFVDECENCRIFVGPAKGSVFVRNCRDCSMIIACRQFRSRDCENCKFALFCTTEPVIETSVNMLFGCFDFFYFSLPEQITRSGLQVWNNKWWQIHDFNKNEAKPNWGLLPQEEVSSLLRATQCGGITADELAMDIAVPVTLGCRPWPHESTCFVVFLPQSTSLIQAFLTKARTEDWILCRTRATLLAEDRAKALFAWTKEGLAARCKGQEVTGIQVCGPDVFQAVHDAIASTGLATGSKSMRVVPAKETAALAKAFFETWKDEI